MTSRALSLFVASSVAFGTEFCDRHFEVQSCFLGSTENEEEKNRLGDSCLFVIRRNNTDQ